MKKNVKFGLWAILLLVVGYFVGALVGFPLVEKDVSGGDIGRVNRYKKTVVSEQMKAFEEKIKADEDFRDQTIYSMSFINARTMGFRDNAQMAAEATADIPELNGMSKEMLSLMEFANNAEGSSQEALAALEALLSGKNVNYEELSNNAIISYMLLNRGVETAKEYVGAVDAFLRGNKVEDYNILSFTRDQWASYCTLDAIMDDNEEDMKFWNSKYLLLEPEKMGIIVTNLSEKLQVRAAAEAFFNQIPLSFASSDSKLESRMVLGMVYSNAQKMQVMMLEGSAKNFSNQNFIQAVNQLGVMSTNSAMLSSCDELCQSLMPDACKAIVIRSFTTEGLQALFDTDVFGDHAPMQATVVIGNQNDMIAAQSGDMNKSSESIDRMLMAQGQFLGALKSGSGLGSIDTDCLGVMANCATNSAVMQYASVLSAGNNAFNFNHNLIK